MAKTNPIGTRWDQATLKELKKLKLASTPQAALNFLDGFYHAHKNAPPAVEKKPSKTDLKKESTKVESKSSGGESYLDRRRKMKSGV